MEINDGQINKCVVMARDLSKPEERKAATEIVFELLKPFRYALAKKFANKGVDFDDIAQQIDLKLLEAIHDYDEEKDPSALRHLVSKARNGVWNYYRKEMNYFNEGRMTVSLDALTAGGDCNQTGQQGEKSSYYDFIDDKTVFDEGAIVERLLLEEELLKLTPHQREVLLMYYVDDRTQYSIAEELNINQANVSRTKERGVKSMRASIKTSPVDERDEIL